VVGSLVAPSTRCRHESRPRPILPGVSWRGGREGRAAVSSLRPLP
jgi:hypothetical protein